jgi:lysophospholipase L1-like esterase
LLGVDDRINSRDTDIVTLLIGINDANLYGVNEATLQQCLEDLYVLVTGKKIVAMTYPKFSTSTAVWGIGGVAAAANRIWVNRAIRNAVIAHNANYPSATVRLVDLDTVWSDTPSSFSTNTVDGAHPSPAGAVKIAKKWFESVCGSTTFISGCTY